MSLFVFALFLLSLTNAVPFDELFPFGPEQGDQTLWSRNHTGVHLFRLPYVFPYFDVLHTDISMGTNGLFVFNASEYDYYYHPSLSLWPGNGAVVAGFWHQEKSIGQNETSNRVYFQIHHNISTSNSTAKVFTKIKTYVSQFFPQQRPFQPKMVITGTWYYITAEHENETTELNNTFQVVLATDEDRSFVFFLYHQLQWAKPSNYSYYPSEAGLLSGTRNISYALPYSGTNEIVKLVNTSNVNVPGLFAFRIDADRINAGGCNDTNTSISFRPRLGSQLGLTPVSIYGPCLTNQTKIQCRFNSSSSVQTIDGLVLDEFRAICLTPFVSAPGPAALHISIDGGQTFRYVGDFTYVPIPVDTKEVFVQTENGHPLPNVGAYVTVTWHFADITKRTFPNGIHIDIELWTVNLNERSQLQKSDQPSMLASKLPLTDSARVRIPEDVSACFIRVVARANSDIYAGLHSGLLIIRTSAARAVESCQKWAKQQPEPSTWNSEGLLPCPITRQQAILGGFCCYEPEFHCHKGSSSPYNCWLHRGRADRNESSAVECYTSKYSNRHGASAQCCYDNDGMIITRGLGAGTDDRYRPTTSPVQHFFQDTLPYLQCCLMSNDSESCNSYMRSRPPRRGSNTMGDSGRMWGDPHFGTLDGSSYTFNGHGEYTYVAITNSSSPTAAFDLRGQSYIFMSQIRTVPIASNDTTITTAFAAQSFDAGAKAMSLTISPRQQVMLRRADDLVEFEENMNTLIFPELTLTRNSDSDLDNYTFSWNIGVTIVVKLIRMTAPSRQLALDVGASLSGSFRGKTYGLLGAYDGNSSNDLRSRNGSIIPHNATLEQIHREFGTTWAIDPLTSMFYYQSNQTAQWFHDQNGRFRPSFNDPALSTTNNAAYGSACNINATVSPASWDLAQRSCYYDFAMTNDDNFARASLTAGTDLLATRINPGTYPLFGSFLPLNLDLKVGQLVALNISASSENSSHPVVLSTLHLPHNAQFNTSTGTFQWTAIAGEHYLSIQARDRTNNLASKYEIPIHVAPADRTSGHAITNAPSLVLILTSFHLFFFCSIGNH